MKRKGQPLMVHIKDKDTVTVMAMTAVVVDDNLITLWLVSAAYCYEYGMAVGSSHHLPLVLSPSKFAAANPTSTVKRWDQKRRTTIK
jgi:hypothetical protein